ncbi:MAG: polysaccharide deacetylase family protein [Clostridia bacterium]
MRKILVFLLVFILVFALSACLSSDDTKDDVSDGLDINQSTVISDENITTTQDENREASEKVLLGAQGGSLITGLEPLDLVEYEVSDPDNTAELSTEMVSHSHGPASDGEPHYTVVEFQSLFDDYGAYTLDTTAEDKSIYLTFDCGYEYDNLTSQILDILNEKDVTAAFFCTLDHIESEPELIARMIEDGHIVGNHSTTHPSFAEISRTQMVEEIQTTENYLRENFGYCATFFRFPKGEYTESSLDLVASLGYTNVFWSVAYDDWDVNDIKGATYATETVISRLHDGAIILLHSVSQDNADALADIIDEARALGYEFKSLEEL